MLTERSHGARHVLRSAVEQVVTVDHRQYHVAESHRGNGSRNVLGLARIDCPAWIAARYCTKATTPRARVAEEHHGGGPCAPALPHVRATRLFTHGVEIEIPERFLQANVVFS